MPKVQVVSEVFSMAGRKKGMSGKCRGDRVQVHATFTFQQPDTSSRKEPGFVSSAAGGDSEIRDKESRGVTKVASGSKVAFLSFVDNESRGATKVASGSKVVTGERLSFADHAIHILDQMMKERSVGELLKLGPREEMLGLTPLSMAAAVGHVEGTRKLLEAGAGVDDKSSDGSTALLNAAHWRHLPVLDLLLQHGACVAATNNDGNNALMVALRHGDVRAVNSMWPHRKSLDINHANNDGHTALHLAAERKWESCVQFLISNGADVNTQNNAGQTALHITAAKGDHPTAERLLTAGASLLLEDHCGNNPFCLAVRGFHDGLANHFLDKLKVEDRLYFCKRRVHRLQSQLFSESCSAWSALSFLTSDGSLRDALYHCDVMRVAVHALGRRGLLNEVAVQSCLVCSDLMYNPFPSPDLRFVKQFLAGHGPEAVLDRLDSRGGGGWAQDHGLHSLELSRELSHLQGHLQSQPQSRQQQSDFNTAIILLPLMAMAETPAGKGWFAETTNQQRIAGHLRRVMSYRELLQLLGAVQQENPEDRRQLRVDRVAVMERFIAFYSTLENRDREEKMRQLLEQEEREKNRKEKKREKKRQQRLKQKLKSRANDTAEVKEPDPGSQEQAVTSDPPKVKCQTLDALDDIPLTVGPHGVRDVSRPAATLITLGLAPEAQGNEEEWVMVGGKRCFPPKIRTPLTLPYTAREDSTREPDYSGRKMEARKSTVSGLEAIAIISKNQVSGLEAIAINSKYQISGLEAITINSKNQVSGLEAIAINSKNQVSGLEAIAINSKNQISGPDTRANSSKNQVSGPDTRASSSKNQISGPDTRASSSKNQISGPDTKASSSKNQISGPDTRASSSKSQISGPDTRASSSKGQISGTDTRASSSKGQISVPDTRASSSKGQISGPDTRASSSKGQISVPDTKASSSKSQISGPDTRASSSKSQISGPDTRASSSKSQISGPDTRASSSKGQISGPDTRASSSKSQISDPDTSSSKSQISDPDTSSSKSQISGPDTRASSSKSAVCSVDTRASSSTDEVTTSTSLPSSTPVVALGESDDVELTGPVRQTAAPDVSSKINRGGKRWADVARNGNVCLQVEESGLASSSSPLINETELDQPPEPSPPVMKRPIKKAAYHEQFPSLGHQPSEEAASQQHLSVNATQSRDYKVEVMGAAHQFLEKLCNTDQSYTPGGEGNPGQGCTSKASANRRMDPSVLYEALTGWMWQAAVSRGLITPDTDPFKFFTSKEFLAPLASQFLKPPFPTAASQYNMNHNIATVPESSARPSSDNKIGNMTVSMQTLRIEPHAMKPQSSTSTNVSDWFNLTNREPNSVFIPKSPSLTGYTANRPHRNQTRAPGSVTVGSMSSHNLSNSSNNDDSTESTNAKKSAPVSSSTRVNEKDRFLLTGNNFSPWLPSRATSSVQAGASASGVCRKPVLDYSELPGFPFIPGSHMGHTAQNEDTFLHRHLQQNLSQATHLPRGAVSSDRFMTHRERQDERYTSYKPLETGADAFKQIPLFGSMVAKEKSALSSDYHWLLQDVVRDRMKTAVVSVPRSSDSDSTQSSSPEQRNDGVPEDIFSVWSDTSRSSCLNNDSFHQLSAGDCRSSALSGGLHECLAPGFIRAAVGDPHHRSFGVCEDAAFRSDVQPNVSEPLFGNIGRFSSAPGNDTQRRLDSQYPDLSVVPEREQSLTFPTQLPKARRAVGQGRPIRSKSSQLDTRVKSHHVLPNLPLDTHNQTGAFKDGASALPSSASAPVAAAAAGAAAPPTTTTTTTTTTVSSVLAAAIQAIMSTIKPREGPATAERPDSPDVLFPESLREEDTEEPTKLNEFPSIHDMTERDLLHNVFSNSYFLEQIAIDQIRRRLRALGGGEEVLRANSVLFHDLDYYASLYGVRLRDILGPSEEEKSPRAEKGGAVPKKMLDQSVPAWKAVVKELGRRMSSKEDLRETGDLELNVVWEDPVPATQWPWSDKVTAPPIVAEEAEGGEVWWQEGGGSRRWRKWLRQILDLPWTMRRQFGKIVLPARSMEFNIGRTGHHPLILGFLTDGTEVGVLALDSTRHALDTRLMATVAADSEPDVHFVLRYKAVWESAGRVYLAMELCDYTLDEYVGIVRLDHRQDPLSANRLAWQLLKGLKYLHSNFTVPHGNLMPAWIFVDCDGRLRLAGYGLRDVTATDPSAGSKDREERDSIEGDSRYWRATDHTPGSSACEPTFQGDIQVAGMLVHYILTGGHHPYGETGPEVEANLTRNVLRQHRVSQEADHLVTLMTLPDPMSRPAIDTCLKHPFFWSGEKRFRLVLIVGSDILTEMKTGMPLTGAGSTSMVDILNIVNINTVSENWVSEVDSALVKEMRAFRQYKNNIPELVLFVYNCCLHYDKMSTASKEVLDDPCKYFQTRFTGLFMAVYRAMRASDRTERTCYKPFF